MACDWLNSILYFFFLDSKISSRPTHHRDAVYQHGPQHGPQDWRQSDATGAQRICVNYPIIKILPVPSGRQGRFDYPLLQDHEATNGDHYRHGCLYKRIAVEIDRPQREGALEGEIKQHE